MTVYTFLDAIELVHSCETYLRRAIGSKNTNVKYKVVVLTVDQCIRTYIKNKTGLRISAHQTIGYSHLYYSTPSLQKPHLHIGLITGVATIDSSDKNNTEPVRRITYIFDSSRYYGPYAKK